MASLMPWCFGRGSDPDSLAEDPVTSYSVSQLRAAGWHHSVGVLWMKIRTNLLLGTWDGSLEDRAALPTAAHAYHPHGAFSFLFHSFFKLVEHLTQWFCDSQQMLPELKNEHKHVITIVVFIMVRIWRVCLFCLLIHETFTECLLFYRSEVRKLEATLDFFL